MITQAQPNPLDQWRALALRFHTVAFRVRAGQLRPDFEPEDVDRLVRSRPLSPAELGVLRFLCHVWSYGDHPFELSETARWDSEHRAAFIAWATGEATGEPGHFF